MRDKLIVSKNNSAYHSHFGGYVSRFFNFRSVQLPRIAQNEVIIAASVPSIAKANVSDEEAP